MPFDKSARSDAVRNGLLDCYRALDEEIGRLVDGFLPPDAHLALLSDHGFGPWDTNVHLNDWLAHHGWLAYDRRRARWWEALRWAGSRVKRLLPGTFVTRARRSLPLLGAVDWSMTQAYAGLPTEYGVFVNLRGREPAGIVDQADYEGLRTEIIAALKEWRDPRTGEPIVSAAYRREELYVGPFVSQAPDIVFELERGYRVSDLTGRGSLLGDVSPEGWGFHEREGIFGMSGPGISPGVGFDPPSIADVMPTLLYALGLPVPDDLDGRVLVELFDTEWQAVHPLVRQSAGQTTPAQSDHPYSSAEEDLIERRLRGLGYLE